MKLNLVIRIYLALMFLAAGSSLKVRAFSLLGPIQPWMQATNGVILSGDIGGPMCISNGYRWNVPVVTYGFDKTFVDYFGTNGVAAVEGAIAVLNDLPPASQIFLTNYPFNSQKQNYEAEALSLLDLKSITLSLLLEQMGLTEPVRNTFVLKQWSPFFINNPSPNTWPVGIIPDNILQLNFEPQTYCPSAYVNQTLYTCDVLTGGQDYGNFVFIKLVDPLQNAYSAVADFHLGASMVLGIGRSGVFYTGLTYDDVGGLTYLLSTNNFAYETLLSNTVGNGTNANSFVNGAWRPGVDKITFIPQPVNSQSGAFLATTNYFTDSYITNSMLKRQQMARIISQPDFIFSAGDIAASSPALPFYDPAGTHWRTGTTNWINNATLNGNINGAGPGVIQPQVQIIFNKSGPQFYFGNNGLEDSSLTNNLPQQYFGSFDNSTNSPIVYPQKQTGLIQFTVRMWLEKEIRPNNFSSQVFEWKPTSVAGNQFAMQTSTNLQNWVNLFTVSNDGTVCNYFNYNPSSIQRFYRLVPQ